MNETSEEKQWLAKRIESLHEIQLKEIENNAKRYEKVGKSEISRLKGRRNNIFSILGIALTIMFGLNVSPVFETNYLVLGVGIISILGISNFVLFAYYIRKIENLFILTANHFLESEMIVNISYGYTLTKTSYLSNIDFEELSQDLLLITIIISAINAQFQEFLKEMRETMNLDENMKQVFTVKVPIDEKELKYGTDELIKAFAVTESIPKVIITYIQNALKISDLEKRIESETKSM